MTTSSSRRACATFRRRRPSSSPTATASGRPACRASSLWLPGRVARARHRRFLPVTRDLWSLRFNTEFEFQEDTLSSLITSLSENNLFGWRKYLAAEIPAGPGPLRVAPTYSGSECRRLAAHAARDRRAWYARPHELRGQQRAALAALPALRAREPLGRRRRLSSPERGRAPVLRQRALSGDRLEMPTNLPSFTAARRSPRTRTRSVCSAGRYPARDRRAPAFLRAAARWCSRASRPIRTTPTSPPTSLPSGAAARDAIRPLPAVPALHPALRGGPRDPRHVRSAREPAPRTAARARARGRRARPGRRLRRLPDERDGELGGGAGRHRFRARAGAGIRARSSGVLIDQRLSALLYLALPPIAGAARVVISAMTDAVRADTTRTLFFLGGDTGLRGYRIGEFQGTVQAAATRSSAARRSPSSRNVSARLFMTSGTRPNRTRRSMRTTTSVRLSLADPQLNASVLRIDWAVPTQSARTRTRGCPGASRPARAVVLAAGFGPRAICPSSEEARRPTARARRFRDNASRLATSTESPPGGSRQRAVCLAPP